MAVTFEFVIEKGFHFAEVFGKRFGMPVAENRVYLPKSLGDGYIQEMQLREGLSLCMHRYILKQEFSLKRLELAGPSKMLTLKFDCRKVALESGQQETHLFAPGCEAELGTGNFFTEIFFPAKQEIYFLVINVARELLVELLHLSGEEAALRNQLLTNPSFVANVSMSVEMESALKDLSNTTLGAPFYLLRCQAKALELIYLLFAKITERVNDTEVAVNRADADKLYEVRSMILKDLSVAPRLNDLSKKVNMSPTKMKTLFRQIFGDSIYNYFQHARMNEAARLLRDHSVTETGYRLGFTNMSHFSRLFEKYFKTKPKKFKGGNL
ncbi:AraC family transcriptional regulator [Flavitalea sp. BT771]|uniref:helix-turn-helix transcriptional regulator n=1 Tax=Flavitalea sp. BT771 TaxID=3063329 RepID=UPI0026E1AE2C|nr:AraC family transcriptional regulator [Flavitalea sp. BT771]MDO6429999.1 AraC family transcriptional regulator [Flavitalea sp. BT771]MDV6217873.1 AraC family transcriptional regulator [Flavitalea sp. BT771]